jgi:hypothetical protein
VSGINRSYKAIAPTLTDEPAGQNPEREFNARLKETIAKHTGAEARAEAESAREGAAPPPKAKTGKTGSAGSPTAPKSTEAATSASQASASTGASTPAAKKKPSDASSAEQPDAGADAADDAGKAQRGPRYEPKSFWKWMGENPDKGSGLLGDIQEMKRWAEANPELSADLREKVFGLPADTRQEWIRIKNKQRNLRGEIVAEREKTVAEVRAEREQAKQHRDAIEGAVQKMNPIVDLWDAVREPIIADPQNPRIDFDAADAAFAQNAGLSIDDYMRARARRGISSPDAVRARVENAKLKRELETLKKTPAAEPEKPAPAEPDEPDESAAEQTSHDGGQLSEWNAEIPSDHKLRQFDKWQKLLDNEMRRYYDADRQEYDADPEEIADKILKREIERMAEEFGEPEPPARTRAAPPGKRPVVARKPAERGGGAQDGIPPAAKLRPKHFAEPGDENDDEAPKGFAARQRWAIDRAQKRARGELAD